MAAGKCAHGRDPGGRSFSMKQRWFRWWWALLLIPIAAGFARLHFEADVLTLLPGGIPAVQGLKLYQQHFGNSSQLILTVQASSAEAAKSAAQSIAVNLRRTT